MIIIMSMPHPITKGMITAPTIMATMGTHMALVGTTIISLRWGSTGPLRWARR